MKKIILLSLTVLAALSGRATVGGPDGFGYTFIDSNEPGGPIYSWIEIATPAGGAGTLRTALACDDCHEASVPLGFTFPYYGNTFTNITMGSNGTVYFENVYLGLSNSCVPGTPGYTMAQYNFIAHLWDDLAPNYQGGVYTQAFTDYFVIEYYDVVPCCTAGDGDTWEVILFSNGNILMQYKELSNQGVQTDFTVGIQNNPTTGLQYLCNGTGTSLANGRAILWLAPGNTCTGTTVDLGTGPFCVGDVLNAPANAIANLWSDLSTGTTFTVAAAGSVSLTALFNTACSATTSVTTGALPTVTATATDLTPCENETITLNGGGADSYAWDNGVTDGVAFAAAAGSTVYTVTGTELVSGCSNTATVTIDAFAAPSVSANTTNLTPCEMDSIILTGSGADSYAWDNGVTDGVEFQAITGTTVYTVTGTEMVNGCSGTATVTITTIAPPAVTASSTDLTPCEMDSIILTGSGADTYAWDNGVTDGALFAPPAGSTTYTVTGTSTLTGCSMEASITIDVQPLPVVSYTEASTTLCTYFAPVTLTEGTPAGGTFSGTSVTGNSFDPGIAVGTYDVVYTYTDGNNCTNSDTVTFNVSDCLGLTDAAGHSFNIYPNPTSGLVTITGLTAGDIIRVYGTDGKLIQTKQAANVSEILDLSELSTGIYLVEINTISIRIQKN